MKRPLLPENMSDMLVEWLRAGLDQEGKTNTGLAHALGIPQSRVAEMKIGKRKIKASELKTISKYLEKPLPDDVTSTVLAKRIMVVGMVGAGAEITTIDDHAHGAGLEETDPPPGGASDSTVALIVRGDSMEPAYSAGDVIYYDRLEVGDLANLHGRTCVIRLPDGRTYLKRLFTTNGTYLLQSHNAEPIFADSIEWAARVLWVKKV